MTMPNPTYPSPAVPPMNSAPAYYPGPTPIQYASPGQPTIGYYPPMASMQMGADPMVTQPYGYYNRRRNSCCHPDSCCYGLFAMLCLCCCCFDYELEQCCC